MINDAVGGIPVAVVVNEETKAVKVFLRAVGEQLLTLRWAGNQLIDEETGTTWDPVLGIGQDGAFAGETLRPIPYIPAFPDAWQDFYPHTDEWTIVN